MAVETRRTTAAIFIMMMISKVVDTKLMLNAELLISCYDSKSRRFS